MPHPLSRRQFLQSAALAVAALKSARAAEPGTAGEPAAAAPAGPGRHPILRDTPAANFLEGAILGNGELGVVVQPLPDAVMIHLGHNAVWDQRMKRLDLAKIGTFAETLKRLEAVPADRKTMNDEPWFAQLEAAGKASYTQTYPRPVSCGAVTLGFDRREAEVLGYRLLIDRGLCQVDFLVRGQPGRLEVFAEMGANRVWARFLDGQGAPAKGPFEYVAIVPDGSIAPELPRHHQTVDAAGGSVFYRQLLPFDELAKGKPHVANPKDRAFAVSVRAADRFDPARPLARGLSMGGHLAGSAAFTLAVQLDQGLAADVPDGPAGPPPAGAACLAARREAQTAWADYWSKSAVTLDDPLLEETWYWNNYFLRCAVHARSVAPGLYAICPCPNRPTVWHSDYHMDYNTEQAFWSTFSINHPELNLPYVEMVHHVLPEARKWARDYYGMRGAYFPVSAYPVELRGYPYGAPVFNWMICINAWWVQGLWWHYVYTQDADYLRAKGFEPIQAVVQFLVDYIRRPDVAARPWGDAHCHIFPTFTPEIYGLVPGLPREFNADTLVDLTLIRFIFLAYREACRVLGLETQEAADLAATKDILERLPPYPTAVSPRGGRVFISVPGEEPERVFNVPVTTMSVFPGEHHGLHSPPDEFALAANTYRQQQNEGGNDLVFLSLQGARLGLLDLEKFKREIRYTRIGNGTCTDLNLHIGGRFSFGAREYDWMASYGIWFENFSVPAVINECLLQSYHGELRLFPNWPKDRAASFRTLRAAGAFLVSAECAAGAVRWVEVVSERGAPLTVVSPWPGGAACRRASGSEILRGERFTVQTRPGERLRFTAAGA